MPIETQTTPRCLGKQLKDDANVGPFNRDETHHLNLVSSTPIQNGGFLPVQSLHVNFEILGWAIRDDAHFGANQVSG